jgi:hypothetical protein
VSTQDVQMKTWKAEMGRHMDILGTHIQKYVDTLPTLDMGTTAPIGPGAQKTENVPIKPEDPTDQWASVGSGHAHLSADQRAAVAQENQGEEQGNVSGLILAAFLRLGTNTPDAWIAREVGCSRRTVARWKKRFQEQGRLIAPVKPDQPVFLPTEGDRSANASQEPSHR